MLRYIIFCLFPVFLLAQDVESRLLRLQYETISAEKGLSQNIATCIFQDQSGFMWIGTREGLNRFDGYHATVFKSDDLDSGSISFNFINCITEDRDGRLWVGTEDGLNYFDPIKQKFHRIKSDSTSRVSLSHNHITTIHRDSEGELWIGTLLGLHRLVSFDKMEFEYFHSPLKKGAAPIRCIWESPNSSLLWIGTTGASVFCINKKTKAIETPLPSSKSEVLTIVWTIYEENPNEIWFGTPRGLVIWNRLTDQFEVIRRDFTKYSISDHRVRRILKHDENLYWIGTTEGGINLYDRKNRKFYNYKNFHLLETLINDQYIFDIMRDRSGTIWIATYSSGLIKISPHERAFIHYQKHPQIPESLIHNLVRSFLQDREGRIWIGTDNGFDEWDRAHEKFIHHHVPEMANGTSVNEIRTIFEDEKGYLWIGTRLGGVYRWNRKTDHFKQYSTPQNLSGVRVYSILQKGNYLFIGSNIGINRLDLNTETISHWIANPTDSNSISNDYVNALLLDRQGTLWAGSFRGGLDKINLETNKISHIKKTSSGLTDDHIQCLYEDQRGQIWIGTADGLNVLDPATGKISHYQEADGLPNNVIYAITEDFQNRIWVSTNNGLSRMSFKHPGKPVFTNYTTLDGLQSSQFEARAAITLKSGELLFGGINGFNIVDPSKITFNPKAPPIFLTSFKVFQQEFPLDTFIGGKNQIELDYRHNFFSIEFSALDYTQSRKNQYAYKMEDLDRDWILTSSDRRFANYTDVAPGVYRFRVKGSNNDGIWNDNGTSVAIVVNPPFWATWWFTTIAFGSLILMMVGSYLTRIRGIKNLNRLLEKKVDDRTEELQQSKNELQKLNDQLEDRVSTRTQELHKLSEHLVNIREDERTRIAREVHDELGQYLTALKMDVSFVAKRLTEHDEILKRKAASMTDLIDSTVKSVQRISSDLRPGLLDDLGLSAALEWQAQEFQKRTEIRCICYLAQDTMEPGKNQSTALFRIFQETLTNIIRHSNATEVIVELFEEDQSTHMIIRDNGKGITKANINNPNSLGLIGMKERVRQLHGSLEFFGEKDKGTTIHVSIPLIEKSL